MVIENAHATAGLKECWKHRLQVLKKDLGYDDAPMLEQLLIQQAALCWLKLNLVELSYSGTMKQSITLTLGIYWEKRLSAFRFRMAHKIEYLNVTLKNRFSLKFFNYRDSLDVACFASVKLPSAEGSNIK